MNEEHEDKWISLEEAADYLGVNKDTIRNWIKKRQRYSCSQDRKNVEIQTF